MMNNAKEMDIVMTKWAGMYGTGILAKECEEVLCKRYPRRYIREATKLLDYRDTNVEIDLIKNEDIVAMHDVSDGGVFGALWQILKSIGQGGEIWLEKIPIKQETIEICEFYSLNPYMLQGQGSLLFITYNAKEIIEKLMNKGIISTVIGKTTDHNDRVVMISGKARFLVPPKGDELNRVFGKRGAYYAK